jgi:transposase
LQDIRNKQNTKEWKSHYDVRAGIEGTLSQGIRALGLRRCQYLGLAKTQLQHVFTAAGINVLRLGDWMAGVTPAKTRRSRFAILAPTI